MNASNAKDYLPLVQALADGKVIQHQKTDGTWIDDIEFSFDWPAHRYRIKPEPREIWVNRYPDGDGDKIHPSRREAEDFACPGAMQVRYREVVE